jgi:hypothetical protein
MASWWADKTRQVVRHLRAQVSATERADVAALLSAAEMEIWDGMHVADRRHGLDVVAHLRAGGVTDREVLVAGLLHDCAKGDTGIMSRIVYSLGQRYGRWVRDAAALVPAMRPPLERLRVHADASADRAAAAGSSARTVELIRHQDAPLDPVAGEQLRLADEAS